MLYVSQQYHTEETNSHSRQRDLNLPYYWKFYPPFGFIFFPQWNPGNPGHSHLYTSLLIYIKSFQTVYWFVSNFCNCKLMLGKLRTLAVPSAGNLLTPKGSDFCFNDFLLCWLWQVIPVTHFISSRWMTTEQYLKDATATFIWCQEIDWIIILQCFIPN